jgi:DNA ligase-1
LNVIKTFPTLYARTSTGAVQIWFMEQDGDKYRSTSGQKDGQKVVADWTAAVPKNIGRANATTAGQQALSEIESKYEKQLKSGGYWEKESDIDNQRFFQVMLAKNYEDYKDKLDWKTGVGVQIKYNGERVLINSKGAWTRTGEPQLCIPHIVDALQLLFKKYPHAVLDGEGFNYDKREALNEIHSIMSKKKPTTFDLQKSKDLIRFYCYDGFGFPATRDGVVVSANDCYLKRKSAIDNAFFAPCFAGRYQGIIEHVPTWIAHSEAEVEKIFLDCLSDKQEGVIVRILGQGYDNKRSCYLLKYKPVDDAEFRILAINEGVGKFAGRVGTFTCEKLDRSPFANGERTFDATFKGTKAAAIKAWHDGSAQKMVGQVATILFNKYTSYGIPNYPRLDWLDWNKH